MKTIRTKKSKAVNQHQTLGKDLLIKSESELHKNEAGMRIKYAIPAFEVIIPIGKDHTALLIMDEDAYNAFISDN